MRPVGRDALRVSDGRVCTCLDCGALNLGDEAKKFVLLAGGERRRDHIALACVQGRKQLVEDGLCLRSDVDEELSAIYGMRHALHESAPFERVEKRGHRARRDEHSFGDHRRFQRLTRALDDREDLSGTGRELVLLARLTVVELHQEVRGVEEVGEALGGQRAGFGVLLFEIVIDSPERFGDASRRATGAALLDRCG
jgi:hypothetical protein